MSAFQRAVAAYNDRERSIPFGKRLSDPARVEHFRLLGELYKSYAKTQSKITMLQIAAAVERERSRCEKKATE